MTDKQQPSSKLSEPNDQIRAGLILRLCTVLILARAQKEQALWRPAIIRAALSGAKVDFQETGNPLHLLNGFVTARRSGTPVPEWVLQPLTAAIERVLASKGKITLDEALGLKPKRGQRTRWTEQEQHEEDARRKWLFDQQLKAGLPLVCDKLAVSDAVEAVATLLGCNSEDADKQQKIRDNLRQAYQKRLKQHDSRLSR